MKTNVTKIVELLKENEVSAYKLTKDLNLSNSSITDWKKGKASPSSETIAKIAAYFNVSTDYILGITTTPKVKKKGVKIPVLGVIPAGIPIEAIEEIIDYEEITEELAATGEFFGLLVRGDSMMPRICDNDIVIVKKQDDCNTNDVCVVMLNGENATIKQVKKENGGIWLVPFNTKYSPIFYDKNQIESYPVKILGKVDELRRKF